MGVHRELPPDPTVKYIKEVTPGFVKDLAKRPQTRFTYKLVPPTASSTGSLRLDLDITDETRTNLKIESFIITVPVGSAETDLFARPEIKNDSTPGKNQIQCTVSDPARFVVKASLSPSSDNHLMLFQINAKDKTKALDRLKISFTGTLNGKPGKANISIKEIQPEEKGRDDDARTDRVKNLSFQKK